MLAVDYYLDLLRGHAPPGPYAITPGNILPWLAMQGIFVGISEVKRYDWFLPLRVAGEWAV